jgi:PAS domain S-box-containing protein
MSGDGGASTALDLDAADGVLRGPLALLEQAQAFVVLLDPDGHILHYNRYAEEASGLHLQETLGLQWICAFVDPGDRRRAEGRLRETLVHGRPTEFVTGSISRDGDRRMVLWSIHALTEVPGTPPGGLVIGHDVSDRKIERSLAEIAIDERRRLAQDLHDSLGGQVSGAAMLAEVLHKAIADEGSEHVELAAELVGHLRDTSTQVREISRWLLPVEVDAYGLMAALRLLAEHTNALQLVSCTFACNEPVSMRDNGVAIQLYRIAEEAVQNAVRHSGAQRLTLRLEEQGGDVVLSVRDDGIGIGDLSEVTAGMGLRTMRYRADLIGARLTVGPHPHGGTMVRAAIDAEAAGARVARPGEHHES